MESQSKPGKPRNYIIAFGDSRSLSSNMYKRVRRAENYKNNRLVNVLKHNNRNDKNVITKTYCDEITQNINMDDDIVIDKRKKGINNYSSARQGHYYDEEFGNLSATHSSQNFISKCVDVHYVTCSRNIQNNNPENYAPNNANIRDNLPNSCCSESTTTDNKYAEKTTYCRPVMHFYNQEFIYKYMERNARLQRLAKEIALARQIERDKEAWNNYINNLKTKHKCYSNEPQRITPYVPEDLNNTEMIDDFYNTKFYWRKSKLCRNMLEDFYDCNSVPSSSCHKHSPEPAIRPPPYRINEMSLRYGNDPYCYPTSSQGRLIMLEKEKERQRKSGLMEENYWDTLHQKTRNTIVVEIEKKKKEKFKSAQSSELSNGVERTGKFENLSKNVDPRTPTTQYKGNQTFVTSEIPIELRNHDKVSKATNTPIIDSQNINQQTTQSNEYQLPIRIESQDNYKNNTENVSQQTKNIQTIPFEDIQSSLASQTPLHSCKIQCHDQNRCHCKTIKGTSNEQIDSKFKQLRNANQLDSKSQEECIKEKNEKVSEIVDLLKEEIQTIPLKDNQPSEPPLHTCKIQCHDQNRCHCKTIKGTINLQTDSKIKLSRNDNQQNNEFHEESIKQKYERVSENVNRLKTQIQTNHYDKNRNSLTNIEIKLDTLIESINLLMREIQSNNKKKSLTVAPVSCQFNSIANRRLNFTKSDTYGSVRNERKVCSFVQDISSTVGFTNLSKKRVETDKEKIDKILYEELNKSNKVKRDIDEILNTQMDKPCPVQITFDIPTSDRSTEVTDSLSRAKFDSKVIVKEKDHPDTVEMERNMTIAVNTDPLGLLALFRISSQTVKQILSYMPHIDYLSYLSVLQFPQMSRSVSHYICNICGAAFCRPSQLSDHIQQHNLGNSRDCCVCRHVLDLPERRAGLFACKYCGQRFTRAYCCELHQQTCATILGNQGCHSNCSDKQPKNLPHK